MGATINVVRNGIYVQKHCRLLKKENEDRDRGKMKELEIIIANMTFDGLLLIEEIDVINIADSASCRRFLKGYNCIHWMRAWSAIVIAKRLTDWEKAWSARETDCREDKY